MKLVITSLLVFISYGLAAIIVNNEPSQSYWQIISSNFIISYLGIILGLSLTMVVNIYNIIDKIREKLNTQFDSQIISQTDLDSQLNIVDVLFNELEHDIKTIFFLLIFLFVLVTLEVNNIPILSQLIQIKYIKIAEFGSFLLANFIVYDILTALFEIIKASNVINTRSHP